jgi:hypothetical protein
VPVVAYTHKALSKNNLHRQIQSLCLVKDEAMVSKCTGWRSQEKVSSKKEQASGKEIWVSKPVLNEKEVGAERSLKRETSINPGRDWWSGPQIFSRDSHRIENYTRVKPSFYQFSPITCKIFAEVQWTFAGNRFASSRPGRKILSKCPFCRVGPVFLRECVGCFPIGWKKKWGDILYNYTYTPVLALGPCNPV